MKRLGVLVYMCHCCNELLLLSSRKRCIELNDWILHSGRRMQLMSSMEQKCTRLCGLLLITLFILLQNRELRPEEMDGKF